MIITQTNKSIIMLLILNIGLFSVHVSRSSQGWFQLFQWTVIGQILVIINFTLSLIFNERKSTSRVKLLLSRLHLVTISV